MKRVALHIGASSAITLLFANVFGTTAAAVMAAAAGVLLVISLVLKNTRQALVIPIVAGTALFSCLLFIFSWNNTVAPIQQLDGERAYCTFEIVDMPQDTGSGYSYTVKTKSIDIDNAVQDVKVKLYSSSYIDADYYDEVSGYLNFYSFADNGFDSYGYFGEGIFIRAYTDYSDSEFDVNESKSKPPGYYFIRLREKIKSNTAYITSDGESALAYAVLTGDRSELSDEIISNFKICGATHITAVSGLHITMICLGIYYLFKRLGTGKIFCVAVTFITLITYSAVADFSKSVVRAGIMTCILVLAPFFDSKADTLNSLGAAMALICLNPFSVTDPSAVMSVCAILGISVIEPALMGKARFKTALGSFLADSILTSVSVLISTFVPLIMFFGQISFLSIFLNVAFILLAQVLLVFTLGFNLLFWFPGVGFIFKQGMIIAARVLIYIASFCARKLSFLCIDASDPIFMLSAAVALLFCAFGIILFRCINARQACALFMVLVIISSVMCEYKNNNNVILQVTENNAVIVRSGKNVAVIFANEKDDYYTLRDFLFTLDVENAVFVDCEYDNTLLDNLTSCDDDFITGGEYTLCDEVYIKYLPDGDIALTIYESVVTVGEYTVEVGEYTAYRDVHGKYNDSRNYIFTFGEDTAVTVRRETSA